MRALLISTYELGRQPFGLASPAAWLRREKWDVQCVDLTKERLTRDAVTAAALIAFHLPMHTATRLAAPVIARVREINPTARLCAYGLYAPLNADWLHDCGIHDVLGGEFEEALSGLAQRLASPGPDRREASAPVSTSVPRIHFLTPDRQGLPSLDRYATLRMPDGTARIVGSTEASRGCKHLCRHCPIVPVYEGQFRIVAAEVVGADIDAQVAAGAQHITFGDPDFFNGPTHALRIVDALHAAHPAVTYDVTIKIEHLRRHRGLLARLRDTGCLFVTSAVESVDDHALERLAKGHTRQDFIEAVALCRAAGLTLVPTFVAFHPWITLDGYADLLDTIEALDLVDHVAPIQLAIRLLLPRGSKLLDLEDVRSVIEGFDPVTLTYRWRHPDPRVDDLQQELAGLVGARVSADRRTIFDEISTLAHRHSGTPRPASPAVQRTAVPYMSEPWYCCAEPNSDEVMLV
jgi:radical SAM superfamily enzyme YgiQ (UPF0313 family)